MKNYFIIKWLGDISITRKLYFTVGIMALLIATELATMMFSINTLSSVRTYVGAEGLWSKAQKNAAYSLQKYARSHDEKDFGDYEDYLKVPKGLNKSRLELAKPHPDLNIAREGYLEAHVYPDDISGAIHLFMRFNNISYIHDAIVIWAQGDSLMSQMMGVADELHVAVKSGVSTPEKITQILNKMDVINFQLTKLEDGFSYTLGEGSRWLTHLILKLLLCLVLTVEICGLSLTILVSRGISIGLKNIITSAEKISAGNYTSRAKVFSKDEIGTLSNAFNEMTDKLQRNIDSLTKAEAERNKIIADIVQRNKDLEQFSYIVSHNLRAPVANILGIAEVMDMGGFRHEDEKELMSSLSVSVKKLDSVILDLNYILQLKEGLDLQKETVKFSCILEDIKISIGNVIKTEKIEISKDFSEIDEIFTLKSYIYSIFYNLISNSIKYRQPGIPALIEVWSHREGDKLELVFKDNGLGIDLKKRGDQVFVLYKRFHTFVEGKGMGLFMVKTQVEYLGGTIIIASEVNKGTQFRIQFPVN